MSHGQRWNLRKFVSFSCQLQVNAARMSHFLDAETCEFSHIPSLTFSDRFSAESKTCSKIIYKLLFPLKSEYYLFIKFNSFLSVFIHIEAFV